ncbi:unnamed protein product [Gemmata massiliana]|uniref:Uncharacterized protein n=1 Tax=Gemmata massiliana TaxID=1210884 RepID=A0A6P2DAE2_9BACT|nr:hypothetical protein [Gemmata massiliana]VTR96502.1 unnamed protein product [Gemmata massiliana]
MPSFVAVALEGDFLERLPEIARACGCEPVGTVQLFTNWTSVAPFARRTDYLTAAISGKWTVLMDDWNVTDYLFDHPEVCADLAKRYRVRVASAFAQSVSGGCGYRVHNRSGARARSVAVLQDEVLENLGKPLPGEDTSDLEQHDMFSVLDVLGLIGLDVADGVEASTRCAMLQLASKSGQP